MATRKRRSKAATEEERRKRKAEQSAERRRRDPEGWKLIKDKHRAKPESREKSRAYTAEYRKTHEVQVKAYEATHQEAKRERAAIRYKANREKILESNRKYAVAHVEQMRAIQKRWIKNNPERAKAIKERHCKG